MTSIASHSMHRQQCEIQFFSFEFAKIFSNKFDSLSTTTTTSTYTLTSTRSDALGCQTKHGRQIIESHRLKLNKLKSTKNTDGGSNSTIEFHSSLLHWTPSLTNQTSPSISVAFPGTPTRDSQQEERKSTSSSSNAKKRIKY
jgi:hypothetical protein